MVVPLLYSGRALELPLPGPAVPAVSVVAETALTALSEDVLAADDDDTVRVAVTGPLGSALALPAFVALLMMLLPLPLRVPPFWCTMVAPLFEAESVVVAVTAIEGTGTALTTVGAVVAATVVDADSLFWLSCS